MYLQPKSAFFHKKSNRCYRHFLTIDYYKTRPGVQSKAVAQSWNHKMVLNTREWLLLIAHLKQSNNDLLNRYIPFTSKYNSHYFLVYAKVLSPYWFLLPLLGLLCKITNKKGELPQLRRLPYIPTINLYPNFYPPCLFWSSPSLFIEIFPPTLIFQPLCLFKTQESIWTTSRYVIKVCSQLAQFLSTPNVNAEFLRLMFENYFCLLFMTHLLTLSSSKD